MNAMTLVSSLREQDSSVKHTAPSKPSVITMGGCNLLEVLSPLGDFVDSTHFWRATIPVIASTAIAIDDVFEDEKMSRFLDRESKKVVFNRAKEAADSIIVMEAAADFSHNFLQIQDTILPDIRDDVFGEGWGKISYGENSILSSAKVISPDTDYYWDLWKYYFHKLFKELLEDRLERGIQVFFLSRRLCLSELKDGQFVPLKHIRDVERRNRILDDVEKFVAQYKGIILIKPSPDLLYTSEHAPWGGPWEFHPEAGYYADLRSKLLNAIFPGQAKGERYLCNWIAEADKIRNGSRSSYALLENRLANLEVETRALKEEQASFEQKTDSWAQERQHLKEELAEKLDAIKSMEDLHEQFRADLSNLNTENTRLSAALGFVAGRYSNQKLSIFDKLMRGIALYFDAKQLRKMGFSSQEYLEANPDVHAAAMNPESHFLRYGIREGRKITKTMSIVLFSIMMCDFLPSSSSSTATWDDSPSRAETRNS
ncbi:hypothetical protein [Rhizobium sp. AB2/73]|uniref:hypothetical protein n=1 Tax=Rhizobium sp. AB2/73 TaxID=2795216 RepID=UPI001C5FBC71|nr:hypothetical protein [Rhizobium sp. AB2/73]QYA13665.1 hypothetical protein J5284_05440 [Rhizobium sp. AB2/73]UEQ80405.1 hypothetical protein I8E17_16560 [Rhizobium sp. AB2/73]